MNKIKKIAVFLLIAALFAVPVFAGNDTISVLVDGEKVEFDAQPQMLNDRVMVPLRAVFEKLRAEVLWDSEFERVIVNFSETDQIIMYVDQNRCFRNGVQIELDTKPFISEGRTYVPLRFIGESFGKNVEWSDELKTVFITEKDNEVDFVPFGEFPGIPSPLSVNRNHKLTAYESADGTVTAKYSLNGEPISDIKKYAALMEAAGYKNIKQPDENDARAIYYGEGMVITLQIHDDNDAFDVNIYEDAEGITIKEFLK